MYQVRKLEVNLEVATVVQINVKQVLALLFLSVRREAGAWTRVPCAVPLFQLVIQPALEGTASGTELFPVFSWAVAKGKKATSPWMTLWVAQPQTEALAALVLG